MRVLLTSNYKIGNETGASCVTDLTAFALSKKNHVCYLCLGEKYTVLNKTKNLKIITIPSTEINSIAIPLLTPKVVRNFEAEITKFAPQIVHTQNSLLISKLAQIWANKNNVPVVSTFHHIPSEPVKHLLPKYSNSFLTKVIEDLYIQTSLKSFLNSISGVIALNQTQFNDIKKIHKKIKIALINNGIGLNNFSKKPKVKKYTNNIKFVYLGSYIERKNQDFLVKTFKYLPKNYTLTCYGKINSGKKYYEKLAQNKPSNVILNDFTKNVPATLRKFDFFISASTKEVQSLVVIQAMSQGLPVIGLSNETVDELINPKNGLVAPKNISPKEFAAAIETFVEDCNYNKLSKQIKKDSERFEISNVIKKIEKFYKEVITRK